MEQKVICLTFRKNFSITENRSTAENYRILAAFTGLLELKKKKAF